MPEVTARFDMTEVVQELDRLLRRAYNSRDINMQVATIMQRMVDDKFEEEGPGWQPLSAATLDRRRGGGAGARILQDTGVLANGIAVGAGDDFAEVFTNTQYAKFHVEGTRFMPKRDFFDIDLDAAMADASELILEDIGRAR